MSSCAAYSPPRIPAPGDLRSGHGRLHQDWLALAACDLGGKGADVTDIFGDPYESSVPVVTPAVA
jgi:hypothetical protein